MNSITTKHEEIAMSRMIAARIRFFAGVGTSAFGAVLLPADAAHLVSGAV
jgi:hypothetical protein